MYIEKQACVVQETYSSSGCLGPTYWSENIKESNISSPPEIALVIYQFKRKQDIF